MKNWTRWMMVVALLASCGTETADPAPSKPAADPDTTVGDKADALSNRWTDIVGALTPDGGGVEGEIDYPSWFHGYTMELTEGQELNFQIRASESGPVRLYGPSLGTYQGRPFFTRALVREEARPGAVTDFVYEVTRTGTYMVVYGPDYVWNATYSIEVQSVGVPSCAGDDECAADEYCGDNGVRCIMAPCTANFDVCQPREAEGAYCANDRGCVDGLSCKANICAATTASCTTSDDCTDEFCGYLADASRVCKPYAAEGERCGGFVRPENYEACAPSQLCLAPDFIADIPGYCGTSATVDELLNDGARFDGRFVALKGYIGLGVSACTRIGCPVSDPCCNACFGGELLFADAASATNNNGVRLSEGGTELSCSGDSCDVREVCSTPEGIYWIGGVFRNDPNGPTIDIVRKMQGF